jgi:hypothetical protein
MVGGIFEKAARQALVPVYPLDNIIDPFAVCFSRGYRVGKHLHKLAYKALLCKWTYLYRDTNAGLGKSSLGHGLDLLNL